MTLLEQYMADYQRVCAEKVALQEQLEAQQEHIRRAMACLDDALALSNPASEPPPWTTQHDGVLDHIDRVRAEASNQEHIPKEDT